MSVNTIECLVLNQNFPKSECLPTSKDRESRSLVSVLVSHCVSRLDSLVSLVRIYFRFIRNIADHCGRMVQCLRPLQHWDCGFESRYGRVPWVCVVLCRRRPCDAPIPCLWSVLNVSTLNLMPTGVYLSTQYSSRGITLTFYIHRVTECDNQETLIAKST
jgi:hypothetical protein